MGVPSTPITLDSLYVPVTLLLSFIPLYQVFSVIHSLSSIVYQEPTMFPRHNSDAPTKSIYRFLWFAALSLFVVAVVRLSITDDVTTTERRRMTQTLYDGLKAEFKDVPPAGKYLDMLMSPSLFHLKRLRRQRNAVNSHRGDRGKHLLRILKGEFGLDS